MTARIARLALAALLSACGGLQPTASGSTSGASAPAGESSAGSPAAYRPCAGKKCGDACTVCAPGDASCVETAVLKACSSDGVCSPLMPRCL